MMFDGDGNKTVSLSSAKLCLANWKYSLITSANPLHPFIVLGSSPSVCLSVCLCLCLCVRYLIIYWQIWTKQCRMVLVNVRPRKNIIVNTDTDRDMNPIFKRCEIWHFSTNSLFVRWIYQKVQNRPTDVHYFREWKAFGQVPLIRSCILPPDPGSFSKFWDRAFYTFSSLPGSLVLLRNLNVNTKLCSSVRSTVCHNRTRYQKG